LGLFYPPIKFLSLSLFSFFVDSLHSFSLSFVKNNNNNNNNNNNKLTENNETETRG